jgi:hypothetical protein
MTSRSSSLAKRSRKADPRWVSPSARNRGVILGLSRHDFAEALGINGVKADIVPDRPRTSTAQSMVCASVRTTEQARCLVTLLLTRDSGF